MRVLATSCDVSNHGDCLVQIAWPAGHHLALQPVVQTMHKLVYSGLICSIKGWQYTSKCQYLGSIDGRIDGGWKDCKEIVEAEVGNGQEGREKEMMMMKWEEFLPRMMVRMLLVEFDDSKRQIITTLLRKCSYEEDAMARVSALNDVLAHVATLEDEVQALKVRNSPATTTVALGDPSEAPCPRHGHKTTSLP
ncbi:Two-component response regulator-like [Nymphaea thermarum]|nr:Two-component response regulator-like [Nymphaea thermarum]